MLPKSTFSPQTPPRAARAATASLPIGHRVNLNLGSAAPQLDSATNKYPLAGFCQCHMKKRTGRVQRCVRGHWCPPYREAAGGPAAVFVWGQYGVRQGPNPSLTSRSLPFSRHPVASRAQERVTKSHGTRTCYHLMGVLSWGPAGWSPWKDLQGSFLSRRTLPSCSDT